MSLSVIRSVVSLALQTGIIGDLSGEGGGGGGEIEGTSMVPCVARGVWEIGWAGRVNFSWFVFFLHEALVLFGMNSQFLLLDPFNSRHSRNIAADDAQ